jgi:hypothetical protein
MVDKYINRWQLGELPSSEAKAMIANLEKFLRIAQFPYTMTGSPPAELLLSVLEEILIYSINSFGTEHFDIRVRNLEMKIVNEPEFFHSQAGGRYIDTGLSRTIHFGRKPRKVISNEALQEYLTNTLQDLIDIKEILFTEQENPDYEELEKILRSRRRESTSVRPVSSKVQNQFLKDKIKTLIVEIARLKREISFWRNKFQQVTKKSKQFRKNPKKG